MKIGVPQYLFIGLASVFSGYHLVLAIYSSAIPTTFAPVALAMALYFVASVMSLVPSKGRRMPMWMAAFNVAAVVAITLLVTHELNPNRQGGNGYATWYVAAVGTLMTITSTRRRHLYAWLGVGFLVVQTVVWSGPGALGGLGVIGSAVWVAVAHILSRGMAKATRDAQRFAAAEREATEWQAAQEAHLYERQFRLGQTSSMALPMLRQIVASGGNLTEEQRLECLHLEGGIRDEIRGRKLLNDAVRDEVMLARKRGATVTLLDEGGIDELDDIELDRVLNRLAEALHSTNADKVIARTVPGGSETAVTVVGLRSSGDAGESHEDDEVDLWLEIPRSG